MRSFLHRHTWLTYLVVALFLLATSGTAIGRMTCLDGGHSVLSLGKATDCCPEEEAPGPTAEVRPACCAFALVQGDWESFVPNSGPHLTIAVLVLQQGGLEGPLPTSTIGFSWLGSRPPPLATADRLAVISVQRV